MTRLFVTADQIDGDKISIVGDDVHHLTRVLRCDAGDALEVVGPDGSEYAVTIMAVTAAAVVARVTGQTAPDREPQISVTLAQALIKGDRFDWVIQKGTEIGIGRFLPFVSARTVVRLPAERAERRLARWHKIAHTAARQAGRLAVPPVDAPAAFEDLTAEISRSAAAGVPVLLAWEGETVVGLYDVLSEYWGAPGAAAASSRSGGLMAVVGPEGGFDAAEVRRLTGAGARPVSLGPLIFRAETAGPALAAMALYHAGDLGRARGR